MDNQFTQSTFFHKPTMTMFFLKEAPHPKDVVMMNAPVTENGTVLWENQEVVEPNGEGITAMVWDLLVESVGQ